MRVGKKKAFALEYHNSGNGTQSAIAAGYSEKGASSTATRLLKDAEVIEELSRLASLKEKKLAPETIEPEVKEIKPIGDITHADILNEIAQIAFMDTGNVASSALNSAHQTKLKALQLMHDIHKTEQEERNRKEKIKALSLVYEQEIREIGREENGVLKLANSEIGEAILPALDSITKRLPEIERRALLSKFDRYEVPQDDVEYDLTYPFSQGGKYGIRDRVKKLWELYVNEAFSKFGKPTVEDAAAYLKSGTMRIEHISPYSEAFFWFVIDRLTEQDKEDVRQIIKVVTQETLCEDELSEAYNIQVEAHMIALFKYKVQKAAPLTLAIIYEQETGKKYPPELYSESDYPDRIAAQAFAKSIGAEHLLD